MDQSDDSELLPPTSTEVNTWLQNYHAVMGAMPEEAEEPSPNQLASLAKKVFQDDASPYVDFGMGESSDRTRESSPRFSDAESSRLWGMERACKEIYLGLQPIKVG